MPLSERLILLKELENLDYMKKGCKIDTFFNTEKLREGYHKHIDFFNAGKDFNQRLFLGGNRVGKSLLGAYEIACHMMGKYPVWWEGRRFDKPVEVWIAGDISKTTRDILQHELLGNIDELGTGMIRRDQLGTTWKAVGVPGYLDTVEVNHSSGGKSRLQFKSFDQGRKAFQGTSKDIVWLDEESNQEIYQECLLRTMTTNGMMILTFTPLQGLTELVQEFMNAPESTGKKTVTVTWDDAPHLTEKQKEAMYASLPPHQRDARSKGVPSLGSGAIYPVVESDYVISPFEIPKHWKKLYALDVGWNFTACMWMAVDPDSDMSYFFSEHKAGNEQPLFHADAIKGRGAWIPGVIDPASRGRSQADGQRLIDQYQDHGLKIEPANNAVEAGIYKMWEALSTGKLKVFNNCAQFLDEIRIYRRDEKGHIVKSKDHLMDAARYCLMGKDKAKTEIAKTYDATHYSTVSAQYRTRSH
jgi:phage terminase large subunit-like protein